MKSKIISVIIICFQTCFYSHSQSASMSVNRNITFEENVNYLGWPHCLKLGNGDILIVTTDVGPRIIRFGFVNGQNMFYTSNADTGKTGGKKWRLYGGHRFWLAPEVMPLTYAPDNNRVKYSWDGDKLTLAQDGDPEFLLQKEIEITMFAKKNEVEIVHRLINTGNDPAELAPWAISACAAGGRAIVPQEPYIDPADLMLPIRPLVLWAYTRMTDTRYIWGDKFIQAIYDPSIKSETKIGVLNKQEWAAYYLNQCLFLKTFDFDPSATYTDYGCNNEIYINGNFLEVESLGPLSDIAPNESVEHQERWILVRTKPIPVDDENVIEQTIAPILKVLIE